MSILVVTVGTSLFTSASWSLKGPFGEDRRYRRWATELLEGAAARRSDSGRTDDWIARRLQRREDRDLDYFQWEPSRPLRYSAELATLLRWMERQGARDLPSFLQERYRQIDLLCSVDAEDDARIAADYLAKVLHRLLGISIAETRPILPASSILEQVRQLETYLRGLPATEEVDLVVSGGYKVYAMVASELAASQVRPVRWRVIYVHESNIAELVVHEYGDGRSRVEVDHREAYTSPRTIEP